MRYIGKDTITTKMAELQGIKRHGRGQQEGNYSTDLKNTFL